MEFTSYVPGVPSEGLTAIEDGDHVCKITAAEQHFDERGASNLRVTFMPVARPEDSVWPVIRIGDNTRGLKFGKALADALGIDRSERLVLHPDDLIGRKVTIRTARFISSDGRSGVSVESIAAAPVKPVTKKTEPKPKQKPSDPAPVDGDEDFPF